MTPRTGASSTSILATLLALLVGVGGGLGGYTFLYAKGASYLSNDPEACVNCHVMRAEYEGWMKSAHGRVAVCNDCHTPHDLLGKYLTKAANGFHHSLAFTTGDFPDNIAIKARNRAVTESACRSCHGEMVSALERPHAGEKVACLSCHADAGHME